MSLHIECQSVTGLEIKPKISATYHSTCYLVAFTEMLNQKLFVIGVEEELLVWRSKKI